MLSRFLRVDVLETSSVARVSAGGGPGVGPGGISREGGCKNEGCDEFEWSVIRASLSIMIVVGSEAGPAGGWTRGAITGGVLVLFELLT